MTMQTTESSHPLLSCTDGAAASTADVLLLIGRILLGWLFLTTAWGKLTGGIDGFAGYLRALQVPAPEFFAWIGAIVECAVFVIVATALAHRYWEYPPAQMGAQKTSFLKNLAILGGALFLFVTGGGRFSIDRILAKK